MTKKTTNLVELITTAPWREAVTFRETWPHEYVLLIKDSQRALFEAICRRMCDGEAFEGSFLGQRMTYLFVGRYKYWFMTLCSEIDLDSEETDYVLNRVRLYCDRRDFHIQKGDSGRSEEYPGSP